MFRNLFDGFMNKVRLIVTIIVALLIVSGVCGVLGMNGVNGIGERLGMLVATIIFGMIMYVIIYFWYGKDYKCPSCNKRFCLKKTGEEVASRENVSVLVETNTKNRNGEVVGSQEQYVPGERVTYRINKVCKKCGKACYSTYRRDIPKV
ncbi:MAG: hypothetical protein ACOCM4_12960 [Acetivibrio ethanolgignens]